MSCNEVKELIQLYIDSELDARSTLDVQRHFESCQACSRLLEAYLEQDRKLKEGARSIPVDSRMARENILAAIRNEPERRKANWFRMSVWKRVAVVTFFLAIATAIALQEGWLPGLTGNVYAAAVADHDDHCSFDIVMGAITDPEELNKLSAAYGLMEKAPDLSPFGYANPRGRTCKIKGLDFLHLVYYNQDRQPLSLFARTHTQGISLNDVTAFRENGYSVASISKTAVDLIVVSSLSEKETSDVARLVGDSY